MIELLNMDCMDYLRDCADDAFELAICDPPYNVGASDGKFGGKRKKPSLINGETNGKHYANHDKVPSAEYFRELFRVSRNQIIWGSNYYPQHLHHSGAIVWDKLLTGPLSDCEIAFQSFNKLVLKVTHEWSGFRRGGDKSVRIHPNQKPIKLYKWLLKNYAKPGDRIFDSHFGSASIAIACHDYGFDLVGCELDKDYYDAACERLRVHQAQGKLFKPEPPQAKPEQLRMEVE